MKNNGFGQILSSLRRERKLSQRQAAAELGVSQALLSHYENSAREPKLEFVIRACGYYDVTADYILGRDDKKKQQTLPAPHDCEGAPRLISAAGAVFEILDRLGDDELYAAVVNYLVVPAENVEDLLCDPEAAYDPMRDARLKLAEAEYIKRVREIRNVDS